jgi:hypothetical protein
MKSALPANFRLSNIAHTIYYIGEDNQVVNIPTLLSLSREPHVRKLQGFRARKR